MGDATAMGRRDAPAQAHPDAAPEGWGAPEPLPEAVPPVPEFDPVLLPGRLRPWVVDCAERIQCPVDYLAAGAMVCLAAVVGRQVAIRPAREDDWTVVPNLWGLMVGTPGTLKSPALAEMVAPIRQLEAEARETHEAEERARKKEQEQKNSAKKDRDRGGDDDDDESDPPIRRRYITSDPTVQKLADLMADNPRGLLIYRDELAGWLAELERDGQHGARQFYMEAWNGNGAYTIDRIGRGTIDVAATCASILGGIQPGPVRALIADATKRGAGDDGLLQRFQVAVWPDEPTDYIYVDRAPDRDARREAWGVYEQLDGIDPDAIGAMVDEDGGVPYLRPDPGAYDELVAWRVALERRIRRGDDPPILISWLAKTRSLMPSLALLCHLADTPGGGPVTRAAVLRALGWLPYLEAHARRLYAPEADPVVVAARALDVRLRRGDLRVPFGAREVYRRGWRHLDQQSTEAALRLLERRGRVRSVRADGGQRGGRPSTRWHVHPALLPPTADGGHTHA